MNFSQLEIWAIIIAISAGTFLLRFSFIGFLGRFKMPDWVLRHLRYTPVAVLPGLVAPLVLWPTATNGDLDPGRVFVAFITLGAGIWSKNFFVAAICGGVALFIILTLS